MLLFAWVTFALAAAPTVPPASSGTASVAEDLARIPQEAPAVAAVRVGDVVTLLTPQGTVEEWSMEAAPVRRSVRAAPGAVGLLTAGDRVWVEIRETRAMPVETLPSVFLGAPGSAAPSGAPSGSPPGPRARMGDVRKVQDGVAHVQGAAFDVGTEVRFLRTEERSLPGDTERRILEREVASGVVRQMEGANAWVDVSRGGRVREGDRVEVRSVPREANWAPQRFAGFREVGGVIRPTLALGTLGVAVVADAWGTIGFEQPWYVSGRLAPVGLGVSRDGNASTLGAHVSGGYDSRYLSVGLGTGGTMLAQNPGLGGYDVPNAQAPRGAVSFLQEARLGARDGVHLDIRNMLVLVPTYEVTYPQDWTGEQADVIAEEKGLSFVFGAIAMEAWVPTGDAADALLAFQAGANGVTTFEAGVHSWVRGNGDSGSLGLRVAAGYATLQSDDGMTLQGPMVSVGARRRF